MKVIPETRRVR